MSTWRMGKQNVTERYSGIVVTHKRERSVGLWSHIDESWQITGKCKKTNTKSYTVEDPDYEVRVPNTSAWADRKQISSCWRRKDDKQKTPCVSENDENLLSLTVARAAQLRGRTKNIKLYTSNGRAYGTWIISREIFLNPTQWSKKKETVHTVCVKHSSRFIKVWGKASQDTALNMISLLYLKKINEPI